jgi:HEPN domain-containing protein
VRRVAEEKGDTDVVNAEKSLKSLLRARARIMDAKATVQSEILSKISGDDLDVSERELAEYRELAKQCGIAAQDKDISQDGVYSKQLQDIKEGDMKKLMFDLEAC